MSTIIIFYEADCEENFWREQRFPILAWPPYFLGVSFSPRKDWRHQHAIANMPLRWNFLELCYDEFLLCRSQFILALTLHEIYMHHAMPKFECLTFSLSAASNSSCWYSLGTIFLLMLPSGNRSSSGPAPTWLRLALLGRFDAGIKLGPGSRTGNPSIIAQYPPIATCIFLCQFADTKQLTLWSTQKAFCQELKRGKVGCKDLLVPNAIPITHAGMPSSVQSPGRIFDTLPSCVMAGVEGINFLAAAPAKLKPYTTLRVDSNFIGWSQNLSLCWIVQIYS